MRFNILCPFLLVTQLISAQTFTEFSQTPPFEGMWFGAAAFEDVNGDSHPDLFLMGPQNFTLSERIAKLYFNDGTGIFTEVTGTPFEELIDGTIDFSDINGDGSPDVLITGRGDSRIEKTILYTNDGAGNFTEVIGTPFEGVDAAAVAFEDVNGDGSSDVLIAGYTNDNNFISKLYTNDGVGTFTEVIGTPFIGVGDGTVDFSDVNGDSFPDVLITGQNQGEEIAELYINDGLGNFSLMPDTPFEEVNRSSVAFSDINGDNFPDVLIGGRTSSSQSIIKLYTNDGTGNFTLNSNTFSPGIIDGSVDFLDVNNDNHPDILITGGITGTTSDVAKIYINDGTGNFNLVPNTPFIEIEYSTESAVFTDVNSDGYLDVLIAGANNSDGPITKLYLNNVATSSNVDSIGGHNLDLTTYPNPIKTDNVFMRFNSEVNGFATARIYNLNGSLVSQHKEAVVIGKQTVSIDITAISKGIYFVELVSGNSRHMTKLVIE